MRRVVVPAILLAIVACASEEVSYYPCPDCPDGSPDVAEVQSDGGEEVADGSEPEPPWAGLPCEVPADCGDPARTCVTETFLGGLGLEGVAVPNGMCSRLLCNSDADCGPQGLCFDATPLAGTPIRICLLQCEDLTDCRWEEGYSCLQLSSVMEGGEGGACVSDSIAVAILSDEEGSQ